MNDLLIVQKRSFFTALAAVACFSTTCNLSQADEAADHSTQKKSPRTVIKDHLPPVAPVQAPPSSHDRAPVRLATGAAARGWLGRMPERRQTQPPESVLPPPAPPIEPLLEPPVEPPMAPLDTGLFPVPVPPAAIRRTNDIPALLSLRRGTILAAPLGAEALLPQSVSTFSQPLQVQPISQSETSPPEPTPIPAPQTPATVTPEGATPKDSAAASQTSPAMSDIDLLLYGRPLTSVSLSSAMLSETLTGDTLKTPDDQAGQILAGFGAYEELPAVRYARRNHFNQHPMFFNPLYFEDPNLERCGQGHGCFTELVSVARFFGRVPVVPYMLGAQPPLSCVRSLGDCPTCHTFGCDAYLPPLDKDAAAWQTACTVGLIFLLP